MADHPLPIAMREPSGNLKRLRKDEDEGTAFVSLPRVFIHDPSNNPWANVTIEKVPTKSKGSLFGGAVFVTNVKSVEAREPPTLTQMFLRRLKNIRIEKASSALLRDSTAKAIVEAQKGEDRPPNVEEYHVDASILAELQERIISCVSNRAFEVIEDNLSAVMLARFDVGEAIVEYDERFLEQLAIRLNLSVLKGNVLIPVLEDLRAYVIANKLRGKWGSLKYLKDEGRLVVTVGERARLKNFPAR